MIKIVTRTHEKLKLIETVVVCKGSQTIAKLVSGSNSEISIAVMTRKSTAVLDSISSAPMARNFHLRSRASHSEINRLIISVES